MENIGFLKRCNGRYEFVFEELGLSVRGDFAEWVLNAAGEIVGSVSHEELKGKLAELEALVEFGEASPIDVDGVKFEIKERFDILPQCSVSMGRTDYRWVSHEARERMRAEFDGNLVKRVNDMSMMRTDGFLVNENDAPNSPS